MSSKAITKLKVILLLALLIYLCQNISYSQEGRYLYRQAVEAASKGERDFAFMSFHMLLNDFPESPYYHQALFAVGEYYYSIGDYDDACRLFNQLIDDYPNSECKPFALAYLIKLAQKQNKQDRVDRFRKELIGWKQLSLVFRDFKELKYISPLYKNYKALNFIDKIAIFIENEPFLEISF
ncbi:MAG: outer membrane protein assembly factor BamD [Candidatus Omnitrophota bacterium]|jgi:outer membrane protein assembly factor BamD (BamD/ComL family)